MKILAIGQKLFEEKFRPLGFATKSVGPEGVETEMSVTSEISGFGKAQCVKGTNIGTLRDLAQPSGIVTGTGQGIMNLDGDSVAWKLSYAGKASASGAQKYIGTVTFVTTFDRSSRGSTKLSAC